MSSSTSGVSRWSSSTGNCSSTRRRSRSSPRRGRCTPASAAQPIPVIADSSSRPQIALMAILALVMAAGVFFVAGAAAREVRLAELKSNFVASVSHDLKTPLALIQLFAETLELGRVRTPERAAGVLPHHQRRGEEADAPHREHPRLLADGGRPAALPPMPADLGEVARDVVARHAEPVRAGALRRHHPRRARVCRGRHRRPAPCSRRSRTCSPMP